MSEPRTQYQNIYGIGFMLANSVALSMLYGMMKYLTEFVSSNQAVFLYKLIVLIGIIPWVLKDGINCVKTEKLKLHLLRGVVSVLGALLFFHGLSKVDIASAVALNKMEPVLLMIIGALYFKEKLTSAKVYSVLISCVGMLFVMYPIITLSDGQLDFPLFNMKEAPSLNSNYLIIIGAVLLWTVNSSVIKALGKTESNRTQLFYVSIISVLVSMPTALFKWDIQSIGSINIPWISEILSFGDFNMKFILLLAIVAFLHFSHVACYFLSFKVGEMSTVVPFDYTRLVFSGIIGYYFFDSAPSFSSYIGYFLILASGVYLLRVEAKAKALRKAMSSTRYHT